MNNPPTPAAPGYWYEHDAAHRTAVRVLAEINLEKIVATIEAEQPAFCVIDSIQTVYSDQLTSAPGSVAQVRECAAHLTRLANGANRSANANYTWKLTLKRVRNLRPRSENG